MRFTGITVEILLNILFITAVAMFLIGIIAFNVTERIALKGRIDSVKSLAGAVESEYFEKDNIRGGLEFIKKALPEGAWAVVSADDGAIIYGTSAAEKIQARSEPLLQKSFSTDDIAIDIEGRYIPAVSSYKGFKAAIPVKLPSGQKGAVLIYEPLGALDQNIALSQRIIALWIILFLVVIAFFGFYILSRRVSKPIRELIGITEDIASGKFTEKPNLGSLREIKQLYSSLRVMYEEIEEGKNKLQDKITELEQKNDELTKTQGELVASEKLASLGRLSAGVAHEIGNPLSSITGYVDVLKRNPGFDGEKRIKYLTEIQSEIDRLDRIIKTLLDYARPKNYELIVTDINSVLENSITILEHQGVLKDVSLKTNLASESLQVHSDPHQLSQVIINLVLNARDALEDGGEIEITSGSNMDKEVFITISDNGPGIPKELLDRIFDPFFTTKEPGKGTGLGLSVSKRIVQTFNGSIAVGCNAGRGAQFTLSFPRLIEYDKAENFGS